MVDDKLAGTSHNQERAHRLSRLVQKGCRVQLEHKDELKKLASANYYLQKNLEDPVQKIYRKSSRKQVMGTLKKKRKAMNKKLWPINQEMMN